MSRKTENCAFTCEYCGKEVFPVTNGGYRNHCPQCLYSLHVDCKPGDRADTCRGLMKPIEVICHSKKGYQIRHICMKCGFERVNKIAEDTIMPDDVHKILQLIETQYK